MKLERNSTTLPRVAILTTAILIGITIGALIFPASVLIALRSVLGHTSAHFAFSWGVLVFFVLVLGILDSVILSRFRLEHDLLQAFLDYIPDNVYFKDLNGRFIRISAAMARYCGLKSPKLARGMTDADIFAGEHAEKALEDEREIIRTGKTVVGLEEKETWPDGHETWVLTTKVPLKDRAGRIIGTTGISHDITDRKQAELRANYLAMHDHLTGLPNRLLLVDRMTQAIASAKRHGGKIAILKLNLDRYKSIINSLGYHMGDHLLEEVTARLKTCTRADDTVAILGGDEFVLVISGITGTDDVECVAQKVIDAIAEPVQADGRELYVKANIGITRFPDNGENPETLLQLADVALTDSKKDGGGKFCFFSPTLTEATRRQQKLEYDLLHAFSRDQFIVHYQPIIESDSGRITGMEALLRWKHPSEGLIPPDQFIPQLEERGMIVEVGGWVMRTACRQVSEWEQLGLPSIRMAVNISSRQFYQSDIVETVKSILDETGLHPNQLELELTESKVLDESDATILIMRNLKRIGIGLSLDDFGTGWSSLSYLRRFPLDRVKIDRSFVRDITSQANAQAMVKSILGMARNLGFECIAEGVETAQQRDFLKSQHCHEMQGFFFSRPVSAIDATALIRNMKLQTREEPVTRGAGMGEDKLSASVLKSAERTWNSETTFIR
jgi:diguanylate cyclase (GGDEF)-like protein/PAS domain S-box-containing protein